MCDHTWKYHGSSYGSTFWKCTTCNRIIKKQKGWKPEQIAGTTTNFSELSKYFEWRTKDE